MLGSWCKVRMSRTSSSACNQHVSKSSASWIQQAGTRHDQGADKHLPAPMHPPHQDAERTAIAKTEKQACRRVSLLPMYFSGVLLIGLQAPVSKHSINWSIPCKQALYLFTADKPVSCNQLHQRVYGYPPTLRNGEVYNRGFAWSACL